MRDGLGEGIYEGVAECDGERDEGWKAEGWSCEPWKQDIGDIWPSWGDGA